MRCRCEGHLFVTIDKNEPGEQYQALWHEAEEKAAAVDGWHIVECLDCDGSGIVPDKTAGFWQRLVFLFTGK